MVPAPAVNAARPLVLHSSPAAGPARADGTGLVSAVLPAVADHGARRTREEHLALLMLIGTDAFLAGDYAESGRMFMQVALQDPDNADAALAYALARFATADYGLSAIGIRRGVGQFCEVVQSDFDLRDRYGDPAEFQAQLQVLQRQIERNPPGADTLLTLGFVLYFSGQRLEAREVFRILGRMFPDDAVIADCFLAVLGPSPQTPRSVLPRGD